MLYFKKLFLTISSNIIFLLLLIIVIQNSSQKSKVNLIFNETIELPVSFIISSSFISGSLIGSLIQLSSYKKNKNN